jgi:hypothetical protein
MSENFEGYVNIHESWGHNISEEEQPEEINITRNRSSSIEKNYFKKSQNYCSIGELQQC